MSNEYCEKKEKRKEIAVNIVVWAVLFRHPDSYREAKGNRQKFNVKKLKAVIASLPAVRRAQCGNLLLTMDRGQPVTSSLPAGRQVILF